MSVSQKTCKAWWAGKMGFSAEMFFLLLIAVPLVMAYRSMPEEGRFAVDSDEGYYMRYARAFATEGTGAIPRALDQYLATPEEQPYPHPGRFGYTVITGLWLKAFPHTYQSLAHLSYAAMLLFLILSYVFARRYLGYEVATLYTLLLACSPLVMAASRRVLQDSVLSLFWALPFWLFFEYLMRRRPWALAGFFLSCIVALTIKEASVFLLVFFLFAWLIFKRFYKKDMPWGDLVWLMAVPPVGALILYIAFLGGVGNLVRLVSFAFETHFTAASTAAFTPYSLFATGPWFKYLLDLLLIAPWVTVLAVAFMVMLLGRRRMSPLHAYGLLFFIVLYVLLSSMKFTKIIRFGMSLEIVTYLFAILGLLHLVRSRSRWSFYAGQAFLLYVCFGQIQFFRKLFIEMKTYDTISVWLLLSHKVIPYFIMT